MLTLVKAVQPENLFRLRIVDTKQCYSYMHNFTALKAQLTASHCHQWETPDIPCPLAVDILDEILTMNLNETSYYASHSRQVLYTDVSKHGESNLEAETHTPTLALQSHAKKSQPSPFWVIIKWLLMLSKLLPWVLVGAGVTRNVNYQPITDYFRDRAARWRAEPQGAMQE